jgi:SAM-dependent methyltransferase
MKTNNHRIYGKNVEIKTQNTRRFYDDRAKKLSTMPNPHMSVLLGDQNPEHAGRWNAFEKEHMLPKLKIAVDSRVLDIGCGIGRWAETLIPLSGYYCGVDFSAEMVNAAQALNNSLNKRCSFHNLSFLETVSKSASFYGGKFDRLLICGVCMYINDDELHDDFEKLLHLLSHKAVLYLTETVAMQERLTLNECPSEALKTTYDVIYRTPSEYNQYYRILLNAGFSIAEQDCLPKLNNEKAYAETERWYTIFERK